MPFRSRAMEIWLNVATEYFLREASPDVKQRLKERVDEVAGQTFLGRMESNQSQLEKKMEAIDQSTT